MTEIPTMKCVRCAAMSLIEHYNHAKTMGFHEPLNYCLIYSLK